MIRSLAIFLTFLLTTAISIYKLRLDESLQSSPSELQDEVLLLPNGEALELLSLGFENALSNILWFNTMSYFGKHYKSDHSYEWLFHMCDLVTSLDDKADYAFEFCASMLSWEAADPIRSNIILDKAIAADSANWRYLFLRGFNYMYFLSDQQRAKEDFIQAANKDGAPREYFMSMSEKVASHDPSVTIEVLSGLLARAKDESQRKALEARLRELIDQKNISILNEALRIFVERNGSLPQHISDLVASGIVDRIPIEPYGGQYRISAQSGSVFGDSKRLRSELDPQGSESARRSGAEFHGAQ